MVTETWTSDKVTYYITDGVVNFQTLTPLTLLTPLTMYYECLSSTQP